MSFHDATFRLLGVAPRISTAAIKRLEETEHRLGITLPVSVREWYERDSAIRVLADHSNEDPPIDVSMFELIPWRAKTLLPIRYENQGVCTWAIEIDGSDNPSVLVDVDTNGTNWTLLASTFSDYVLSCVWDYSRVLNQPALVQSQNCALTEVALDTLATLLKSELTTYGWPGYAQYRFSGSMFCLLIWNSDRQADWFVGAGDGDSLRRGLDMVWNIDSVGESFYGCTEIGRETLAILKKRHD